MLAMDYGMIGKIEKAKRYAQEPQRITLQSLQVEFKGDNNTYEISLNDKGWHCSCPGYGQHKICPHIMSLERLLRPMLKREPVPYAPGQNVVSDVEKAKRYSEETDRIRFSALDASFDGSNCYQLTIRRKRNRGRIAVKLSNRAKLFTGVDLPELYVSTVDGSKQFSICRKNRMGQSRQKSGFSKNGLLTTFDLVSSLKGVRVKQAQL